MQTARLAHVVQPANGSICPLHDVGRIVPLTVPIKFASPALEADCAGEQKHCLDMRMTPGRKGLAPQGLIFSIW